MRNRHDRLTYSIAEARDTLDDLMESLDTLHEELRNDPENSNRASSLSVVAGLVATTLDYLHHMEREVKRA